MFLKALCGYVMQPCSHVGWAEARSPTNSRKQRTSDVGSTCVIRSTQLNLLHKPEGTIVEQAESDLMRNKLQCVTRRHGNFLIYIETVCVCHFIRTV